MPFWKLTGNMKLSSEAKVGIIGMVTILVLIWGINYLKGRNILNSTYSLQAYYMDSGGLEPSSPILLNGVKIGYVDEVILQQEEELPIKVLLSIEKEYPLPKGSIATLASLDLLGTKGIRINPPAVSETAAMSGSYADEDKILSAVEVDMLTNLQAQVLPVMDRIGDLAESLDQVVQKLDTILVSQAIEDILDDLALVSKQLAANLEPGGSLSTSFANLESVSTMLKDQEDELASMVGHMNSVSAAMDSAGLDKLSAELLSVTEQFNHLLAQVNSGEGSAGKLIYSDSLYTNLETLLRDLDSLIVDLNENPGDYVQFSVFGKSKSKK
jgi:phospholipid/cholesterol/gamma-HCH transport system substrate-binding protein